ncbi:hypothetical protein CTAYLR_001797 [Chrysophaeum taylorii]|uniref:C2 domain-containing protein n=1 Tax=Chrysophaeum taylorii TaxID=2483200 RepID=A0AAD7UGX8_9STRA|nr:hypothetical protein CTAYLR_001797 [Chrysophaeum taylorii]
MDNDLGGGTATAVELKRAIFRQRSRSSVLVVDVPAPKPTSSTPEKSKSKSRRCGSTYVLALVRTRGSACVLALLAWRLRAWWTAIGLSVVGLVLLPEALGRVLSLLVSSLAVHGAVSMTFRGLRIVPWLEVSEMTSPPKRVGASVGSVDDNESDSGESVVGDDDSDDLEETVWRRLARSRLRLEIGIKRFAIGNPRGLPWCREWFVCANDVEIAISMTLSDLWRLRHLQSHWSPEPRHQPVRPRGDGGGLKFGAVRDDKGGFWRNRKMLGVITVDKFDIRDAEVAFEQCEGRLNCVELGSALARGELATLARKNRAARLVVDGLARLRVDVLAARHLDNAAPERRAPSTFVKISVRGQVRQSRTVPRTASPVFAYEPPEPFVVSDPSAVVHVAVYEDRVGRTTLLGQFATTLKQLISNPECVDGGRAASIHDGDKRVDRLAWVPLRDAKWRPFETPRYQIHRTNDRLEAYAFKDTKNGLEIVSNVAPDAAAPLDAAPPTDADFMRDEPDPARYPAVRLRLRWDRHHQKVLETVPFFTALESIKISSAETASRCGSIDNVRAMLGSFPYWLDITGGLKIGRAVAHIRDLFLGVEGELEARRRQRPDKVLLDADWRAAGRHAIKLKNIDVAFPFAKSPSSFKVDDEGGVPHVRGLLTLETAAMRLVRGLVDRLVSSPAKVSSSAAQIAAAIGWGALHQHTTASSSSPPEPEEDDSTGEQQPDDELTTLALALGLTKATVKRFDARSLGDLNEPVAAVGVLAKLTGNRWKPLRCVLRGATIFYFELSMVAAGPARRRGEDRVIDLRRIVVDVDAAARGRNDTVGARLVDDAKCLELLLRDDDGLVKTTRLRLLRRDTQTERISAAAWDAEAHDTFQDCPTRSVLAWHDAINVAVRLKVAQARREVAAIIERFTHNQQQLLDKALAEERKQHDGGDNAVLQSQEDAKEAYDFAANHPSISLPKPQCVINGAFELRRRGTDLDKIMLSEAASFSTRLITSAAVGKLWINIANTGRAVIYLNDGFMAHRFSGPLDKPIKTPYLADETRGVVVMTTVSVSHDGTSVFLSMASAHTGFIFMRKEWRLSRDGDANCLEQRSRWPQTTGVKPSGLLFTKGGDFDVYVRMPPDKAHDVEFVAA